jgi:Protein of unknown function (DUF3443)
MRRIGLLLVVGSVLWMASCGSSGGGNGGSTITSVTVACSPSTVTSGQTSQCIATVMGTGSFSSTVTWSASPASAGTISSSGSVTAQTVATSTPVTITATSTQDTSKSGSTTVTVNPAQQANNVQPVIVDAGPAGLNPPAVNEVFTTVKVCAPNTSNCQTIDHLLVDTGSSGLRLLSSAGGGELTISLPQENDSSGNPLYECEVFLDGYIWGNVALADLEIAGEKASAARVHVVVPSSTSTPPSSCSNQSPPGGFGNEGNSLNALGANGILGVGLFQQDCGPACTPGFTLQNVYYGCPASGCNPTSVTLAQQVTNPVILFASDNNGVLITLPTVPNGGLSTVSGSLIFGIGTQANNGLGSARVYTVPDSGNDAGDFTTIFNGNSYPQSFIDSGSTGLFFLNQSLSGVPLCSSQNGGAGPDLYCPTVSPQNLTATNQGSNGNQGTVNFAIENATTLFSGTNTAFSTLGGRNCAPGGSNCAFDWGLTFFFGRNVFTGIEKMNTPGGAGPYFAY